MIFYASHFTLYDIYINQFVYVSSVFWLPLLRFVPRSGTIIKSSHYIENIAIKEKFLL